jgi:hypothetical protein
MSNTYRTLTKLGEHLYGEGENDLDLSVLDEKDALNNGHLELVPRTYTVTSTNCTHGKQGSKVQLALRVEVEAALVNGGHLERVEQKPAAEAGEQGEKPATSTRKKG